MKARHFLLGATLLSAGLLFNAPLFAAVESDIVGYTTIEMQAGKWYLVGNPFAELTDATTVTINDLFNSGFSDGDTLSVLNPENATYAVYYWSETIGKWTPFKGLDIAADVSLAPGEAVYIHKANAGEVCLKGKVVEQEVPFGSDVGNRWAQIVPMWPADRKLNEISWTGLNDGDTLSILNVDSTTYAVYYWNKNLGKWAVFPNLPVAADDVTLAPGQAVLVRKVSQGMGSLK